MKTKKLTFIESVMLVAGAGIGTGILTIPYAISKIGVFGTLVALALAYAVSAVMYLIIADLTRNSEKPEDLLAILDEHLFSGKSKKALNIIFLVLLVLLLLENLVVYILCAGNVLTDLLGINSTATQIIFYALASVVIIFGVKGEKVVLLKPHTYMNLSGESIISIANFYKIEPKDIVVLYDDIDIDIGSIRIETGMG